ncbi:hypothetical protein FI667_g4236, partial [Globisporangium splendens]
MDDDRQRRRDRSNENGRDRTWRRIIHRELRDELINAMLQELQRITGQQNVRHLHPIFAEAGATHPVTAPPALAMRTAPFSAHGVCASAAGVRASTAPASSAETARSAAEPPTKYTLSSHKLSSSASFDEQSEIASTLVLASSVHSTSLRRHESNNLGDFLANLKKIIYLLEQQPDEMNGMIPARKRTIEYLDVVESHIQRKVLPILYRLRHTYSTILRPIVLNYLKNSARFSRRL